MFMKDTVKKWMELDGQKFLKQIGFTEGQTVLDFGAGEGHYAIPAAQAVGETGKVYALDKDGGALEQMKKVIKEYQVANIELIHKDLKIPLGSDLLDGVLCYDVIHYENKRKRIEVYREIHRVLKKEGLFSVYPKHHKKDQPLDNLADMDLTHIIEEIEQSGFLLKEQILKNLLHDDYINNGSVLNFRRK